MAAPVRTPPIERLRLRILRSLGLTLASPLLVVGGVACGVSPAPSTDEAGLTTDPSGDGSSASSSESGDDAMSSSDDTTSTDDGSSIDGGTDPTSGTDGPSSTDDPSSDSQGEVTSDGQIFDLGAPPSECNVTLMEGPASDIDPECPLVPIFDFCISQLYLGCVPLPDGQSCERICPEGNCIDEWWNCMGDPVFLTPSAVCGPYEIDGQCCSIASIEEDICGTDGRPFVVAGRRRTAKLASSEPAPVLAPDDALPAPVRERLAEHWAAVAQAEHASIASFARYAAQLMAIGAPPMLVAEAVASAGDEVRHADLALSLAGAFAGRHLEFSALDISGAFAEADLEQLTLACVVEGCIGETLAALELATTAARCSDRGLAELLQSIADDEARHAGLAWSFVRWVLAREPCLRDAVAACFERLGQRYADSQIPTEHLDPQMLLDHGCLPRDERERVEHEGVFDLILPCAVTLLEELAANERAP